MFEKHGGKRKVGQDKGRKVAKRITQGLVAIAKTLAFCLSGTELGESCCLSVVFPGQGVGVGSGLRAGGREEPPGGVSRWSLCLTINPNFLAAKRILLPAEAHMLW